MTSRILRLPRRAAALLIAVYQCTLSPDHGPLRHLWPYGYCRHHPTCSAYSKKTILTRGVLIGGALTALRILTCVPWRKADDERLLEAARKASSAR